MASLPTLSLSIFFAAMVLVAIGISMSGWWVRPSTSNFVAAGTASGVMGTTTAIGGPPITLVYQDASGRTLRGSLSAFFVVGSFISILTLAAFGEFDGDDVLAGWLSYRRPHWVPPLPARHQLGRQGPRSHGGVDHVGGLLCGRADPELWL